MDDLGYRCKNCGYVSNSTDDVYRYAYSHDGNGDFKLHPLCPECGHGLIGWNGTAIVV